MCEQRTEVSIKMNGLSPHVDEPAWIMARHGQRQLAFPTECEIAGWTIKEKLSGLILWENKARQGKRYATTNGTKGEAQVKGLTVCLC